jgi:hypothetical protein
MNQMARNALLALALTACTADDARSTDAARSTTSPSSTVETVEPSAQLPGSTSNEAYNGNVVDSGGRVIVNLGSFKDLRSSEPLQHIYQRGLPGVSEDRVYLGATIFDLRAGTSLRFEFDYMNESTPIDLLKHGYFEIRDGAVRRLATSASVTVSQEGPDRLKLLFSKLKFGDEDTINAGKVPTVEPMADGSVVGDVQRFCVQPPGSSSPIDSSNPFCATP